MLVLIKGAGDLASGVAWRLKQCGYDVVMTETSQPTTVRCTVAFSRAVYDGEAKVEGVTACLCSGKEEIEAALALGKIAVAVDPQAAMCKLICPDIMIDAIIAKKNINTKKEDAPIVVALGPGFTAGEDCHAVVETKRGHNLGRVIYEGRAAENTGIPGNINGYTVERILRAPCNGRFLPLCAIGTQVQAGDEVARVDGLSVISQLSGVVRGMLPEGTPVVEGMKAGDVDPRGVLEYCFTVSDKARAIAGGVLEAMLHLQSGRNYT
ncbi:MAG: selenium-dependent molybdenum cofactor biosynthesis protein YqeB [Hydrogenoanaerobacterium sp.]